MTGFLIEHFLPVFIPAIAGYLTNLAMNGIDDVLKLTAKWPDTVKQAAVIVIAAGVTAANAQWGFNLPTDAASLLTQPNVQTIIAALIAFALKHSQQLKAAAPTPMPATKTTNGAAS